MNKFPQCVTCNKFEVQDISFPISDGRPLLCGICHTDCMYKDPYSNKIKDPPLLIDLWNGTAWHDGSLQVPEECLAYENAFINPILGKSIDNTLKLKE